MGACWLGVHFYSSSTLPRVRLWVDPAGRVVLIDAESPPSPVDAYLQALGPPEARLDYMWDDVPLDKGELVWPSKGVVLVANGSKDIVRLGIFAPTTLDAYTRTVRYSGASHDERDEK